MDKIPWGQLYCAVNKDKKVIKFGWKDYSLMLFISTVFNNKGTVNYYCYWLKKTASSAGTTHTVFSNYIVIVLFIPDFINLYNYYINNINKADQL